MKVQSLNFSGYSEKKTNFKNNAGCKFSSIDSRVSSNNLVDINHNFAFLNRKISFNGIQTAAANDLSVNLSSKVNYALSLLKQDEVLLLSNNFSKAKKLLEESIYSFPNVIKKLLFIEDENLNSTIAIRQNIHGVEEVVNLDKESLFIKGAGNDDLFFEKKGEALLVKDGDTVLTRGMPFTVSFETRNGVPMDKSSFMQEFDFSKFDANAVNKLNVKHLQSLSETPADKVSKRKTFADVGGQDAAIQKIKRLIVFPLKYPEAFANNILSHGSILTGGPGTGKTLIAEAAANEVNAKFIKLNGLEMDSKWTGEAEANWRKLFDDAVENQPCLIFIDEIDAVAKKRQGTETSRHDDKIVNQLLTLMSDLEKSQANVHVLAASNRFDILDPAITRSGRFGNHVSVENPDLNGCKQILNIHTNWRQISEGFDKDKFAEKLFDKKLSGADIAQIAIDANNNAYERLGIYEKMENDTFTMLDLADFKIIPQDFDKAMEDLIKNGNTSVQKANKVGYKFGQDAQA